MSNSTRALICQLLACIWLPGIASAQQLSCPWVNQEHDDFKNSQLIAQAYYEGEGEGIFSCLLWSKSKDYPLSQRVSLRYFFIFPEKIPETFHSFSEEVLRSNDDELKLRILEIYALIVGLETQDVPLNISNLIEGESSSIRSNRLLTEVLEWYDFRLKNRFQKPLFGNNSFAHAAVDTSEWPIHERIYQNASLAQVMLQKKTDDNAEINDLRSIKNQVMTRIKELQPKALANGENEFSKISASLDLARYFSYLFVITEHWQSETNERGLPLFSGKDWQKVYDLINIYWDFYDQASTKLLVSGSDLNALGLDISLKKLIRSAINHPSVLENFEVKASEFNQPYTTANEIFEIWSQFIKDSYEKQPASLLPLLAASKFSGMKFSEYKSVGRVQALNDSLYEIYRIISETDPFGCIDKSRSEDSLWTIKIQECHGLGLLLTTIYEPFIDSISKGTNQGRFVQQDRKNYYYLPSSYEAAKIFIRAGETGETALLNILSDSESFYPSRRNKQESKLTDILCLASVHDPVLWDMAMIDPTGNNSDQEEAKLSFERLASAYYITARLLWFYDEDGSNNDQNFNYEYFYNQINLQFGVIPKCHKTITELALQQITDPEERTLFKELNLFDEAIGAIGLQVFWGESIFPAMWKFKMQENFNDIL